MGFAGFGVELFLVRVQGGAPGFLDWALGLGWAAESLRVLWGCILV